MWMVDPQTLCRRHLLGEHVELHMAAAHLRLGRRVDGWANSNCLEPRAIGVRHKALVAEMASRGYRHASPLTQPKITAYQRPEAVVDRDTALAELVRRCPDCRRRNHGLLQGVQSAKVS